MSPASLRLAPDAAMALGIAATAMPFARGRCDGVLRWLRILRLYGDSGVALQALGLGEAQLDGAPECERGSLDDACQDIVAEVAQQACRISMDRGAAVVTTSDLLLAVMLVYGADFDRVLATYGIDREEVAGRVQPRKGSCAHN